jgi:hypothetical protein
LGAVTGSWGTGLYDDETACALREAFGDVARLPIDAAGIRIRLIGHFGTGAGPASQEEVDFWLALADQFHLRGLNEPETLATERQLINSGAGLVVRRELGMEAGDLERRACWMAAWAGRATNPARTCRLSGS